MTVFNIFWPEKDRISIEIAVDIPFTLPVVFAVVK